MSNKKEFSAIFTFVDLRSIDPLCIRIQLHSFFLLFKSINEHEQKK